jgi:3-oxoacid CoA-transferase subunit A
MSILFSGDFHAGEAGELSSVTKKMLLKKYNREMFSRIKYHIILGDGSFLWQGNYKTDFFNYKALAQRPFPVLCVIGNHEPILGMKNLNLLEVDINIGETVYQINSVPFVAYLKRGKVYTIDGFKMLVLGGALSIDMDQRIPGISWWKEEYWSENERKDIFSLLENKNVFDIVISHTGPQHINRILFESLMIHDQKYSDEVAILNDDIHKLIQFKEWWCGHWHQNRYYYDKTTRRGYQYLYRATKIIDKIENQIVVHNEFKMEKR